LKDEGVEGRIILGWILRKYAEDEMAEDCVQAQSLKKQC
jgi:hypothetical protein